MLRRSLSRLLVALVLGGTGALALAAAPAQAAACSGTSGVTVVVTYSGSTRTGCAAGNPSSGLAALKSAGFSYVFASNQPGFVCTISGNPANQQCVKPNYWAYYHAKRGGSWSYSAVGAGSYDPAPGSVEGWAFGNGAKPGISPPAAPAKPKPTPTPTTAGHSTSPTPTTSASASTSATPTPTATATVPKALKKAQQKARAQARAQARAAARKAAAAAAASATATPTPSPSASPASSPNATSEAPGGNGVSWWVGAGLVGVLAVGGGLATWLRRRA